MDNAKSLLVKKRLYPNHPFLPKEYTEIVIFFGNKNMTCLKRQPVHPSNKEWYLHTHPQSDHGSIKTWLRPDF